MRGDERATRRRGRAPRLRVRLLRARRHRRRVLPPPTFRRRRRGGSLGGTPTDATTSTLTRRRGGRTRRGGGGGRRRALSRAFAFAFAFVRVDATDIRRSDVDSRQSRRGRPSLLPRRRAEERVPSPSRVRSSFSVAGRGPADRFGDEPVVVRRLADENVVPVDIHAVGAFVSARVPAVVFVFVFVFAVVPFPGWRDRPALETILESQGVSQRVHGVVRASVSRRYVREEHGPGPFSDEGVAEHRREFRPSKRNVRRVRGFVLVAVARLVHPARGGG